MASASPRSRPPSTRRASPSRPTVRTRGAGRPTTASATASSPATPASTTSARRPTSSRARLPRGQREPEAAALTGRRLDAHLAAVALDDAPAHRQPHPGAGIDVGAVQAREEPEHPLLVLGRDADAVVGDEQHSFAVDDLAADLDARLLAVGELQGVGDEV